MAALRTADGRDRPLALVSWGKYAGIAGGLEWRDQVCKFADVLAGEPTATRSRTCRNPDGHNRLNGSPGRCRLVDCQRATRYTCQLVGSCWKTEELGCRLEMSARLAGCGPLVGRGLPALPMRRGIAARAASSRSRRGNNVGHANNVGRRGAVRVRSDSDWLDDDDIAPATAVPAAQAAAPPASQQQKAPAAEAPEARSAPAPSVVKPAATVAAPPAATPAPSAAVPEPAAAAPAVAVPVKKKVVRASVRAAPPPPEPTILGLSPPLAAAIGVAGAAALYLAWKSMTGRPAPSPPEAAASGEALPAESNPLAQLQQARVLHCLSSFLRSSSQSVAPVCLPGSRLGIPRPRAAAITLSLSQRFEPFAGYPQPPARGPVQDPPRRLLPRRPGEARSGSSGEPEGHTSLTQCRQSRPADPRTARDEVPIFTVSLEDAPESLFCLGGSSDPQGQNLGDEGCAYVVESLAFNDVTQKIDLGGNGARRCGITAAGAGARASPRHQPALSPLPPPHTRSDRLGGDPSALQRAEEQQHAHNA